MASVSFYEERFDLTGKCALGVSAQSRHYLHGSGRKKWRCADIREEGEGKEMYRDSRISGAQVP